MDTDTCGFCWNEHTSGCEYCNPLVSTGGATITIDTANTTDLYAPPLTNDEIRKVRELLAERKHVALLEEAREA
jgi:hypothetical protein